MFLYFLFIPTLSENLLLINIMDVFFILIVVVLAIVVILMIMNRSKKNRMMRLHRRDVAQNNGIQVASAVGQGEDNEGIMDF